MTTSRSYPSTAFAFGALSFALGCGSGANDGDGLGTDEAEKRIDPRDEVGMLELAFPAGVSMRDARVVFESSEGTSALRLDAPNKLRPRAGCVALSLSSHAEVAPGRTCTVEVQSGKTTVYKFSGLSADAPPSGATFGARPHVIVEMVRAGKAPYVITQAEMPLLPVLPAEYRARYTGIETLAGLDVTTTVAGGATATLVLPDTTTKLATLRVIPPSNVELPNASCGGRRVHAIYSHGAKEAKEDVATIDEGAEYKVFPLAKKEGAITVEQAGVRIDPGLVSGKTSEVQLERIDVSDVFIDDGGQGRRIKGTYTITNRARRPTFVGCAGSPTGTGVTVLPGTYDVAVSYVLDGRMQTQRHAVTLP